MKHNSLAAHPAESPISQEALGNYFQEYHARLERMIEFRLDPRIRNRVDPVDLLQDSFLEAQKRLDEFNAERKCSVFVWVRQLTLQILIDVHRANFRQKRNVGQEIRLDRQYDGQATSLNMAHQLIGQVSTPSRLVSRQEDIAKLRIALDSMDAVDQEVLALRHFEHLSNNEVAEILDLSVTAASNRYVRAMSRLAEIIENTKLGGE